MTKSSMSSFSQQHQVDPKILAQWTSKKQDRRTVIVFGGLTVFFTILGLLLAIYGARIQESQVDYSSNTGCTNNTDCTVTLRVDERMEAPVYVYYKLENFFQNHQRYVGSRNDDQLKGTYKAANQLESCYPKITNAEVGVTRNFANTKNLVATDPAMPCGLIAYTMFTDSFTLRKQGDTTDITIRDTGIAWESDVKDGRFKNVDLDNQWLDVEDERFMNWMRVAGLNDFRKLWGVIDQAVEVGDYTLTIRNKQLTSFDITTFDTNRIFCLSTVNSFGGQNILLAVCYLIAAALSWIILIIFLIRMIRNRKGNKSR